jgi:hypothetical protein
VKSRMGRGMSNDTSKFLLSLTSNSPTSSVSARTRQVLDKKMIFRFNCCSAGESRNTYLVI